MAGKTREMTREKLQMKIRTADFMAWCDRVSPGSNGRKISHMVGVSPATFSARKQADSMQAESVVAMSRHLGLDPVQQLGSFKGYESLLGLSAQDISFARLAPLIEASAVYQELLARKADLKSPVKKIAGSQDSQRRWLDDIHPDWRTVEIARVLGTQQSYISRLISSNKLTISHILGIAGEYEVSPHVGLVAIDFLKPEELKVDGVGVDLLQQLHQARNQELLVVAENSSRYLLDELRNLMV
ncbi:hypothetical protein [Rothia sp. ZJ932]|uniref:hypothetical protein n=1 Tax=Rothia sp. ZJ932 TaxID=2810516 RepID=UPI001967EA19|nr:hypothetical protein [Rothia sp. ZJ932]QRZ61809.1 hypothetical protein JR346_01305 [Rothia sp. ZJ932]